MLCRHGRHGKGVSSSSSCVNLLKAGSGAGMVRRGSYAWAGMV